MIRLLVLIIASDDLPLYQELQHVWRSYMHYDKSHVEAYFIKGDPSLPQPFYIQDDIIFSSTKEEGGIPDLYKPTFAGILNKTLLSLEALHPRIKNGEFDFILRTNLSSFFVFPNLLSFLATVPSMHYYGYGSPVRLHFGSGAGFVLSPDLVDLLLLHKNRLMNDTSAPDDVVISRFFATQGIFPIQFPRVDLETLSDLPKKLRMSPRKHIFHFRIKHNDPEKRLAEEIPIHHALIKRFYKTI